MTTTPVTDRAIELAQILSGRRSTINIHGLTLSEALQIAAKLGDPHPRIKYISNPERDIEFYSLDVNIMGLPLINLSLFVDRPDTPFGPGQPEGDNDGDDPGTRPLDGSA